MNLEAIITLASAEVELQFRAMERSLRATGCVLPLLVIPYNEDRFELPINASWLIDESFFDWVATKCAHPMMRKYYALTQANYQYVDSDIIFLRNPIAMLEPFQGFVACCTEWNKPVWTVTQGTESAYSAKWSTWQKEIFCAGQYACDRVLYSAAELVAFAERPENRGACINFKLHDQPGTNLFVLASNVKRTNLTLPPYNMESTWAGDYPGQFESLWQDEARKPYLIHWAGCKPNESRPIDRLFYEFLNEGEAAEFRVQLRKLKVEADLDGRWPLWARGLRKLIPKMDSRFELKWKTTSA